MLILTKRLITAASQYLSWCHTCNLCWWFAICDIDWSICYKSYPVLVVWSCLTLFCPVVCIQVEILATTSLEKRLRAIDKTLDRIQAAAAARQEQKVAVVARHQQQSSNSEHQAGPRQQTGESQQNQHVVTAGHQLPSHIFNSRFLGANRERAGVMGTSWLARVGRWKRRRVGGSWGKVRCRMMKPALLPSS